MGATLVHTQKFTKSLIAQLSGDTELLQSVHARTLQRWQLPSQAAGLWGYIIGRHKPYGVAATTLCSMNASGLHRHLRAWRETKNLSQEQVADILAVNKSTVHRWETGNRTLDLADLKRLADVYEVDSIALLMAPGDVQLAADLTTAKHILTSRDAKAIRVWLEMGTMLPAATD